MITKKQIRRLHALERLVKVSSRYYQSELRTQGIKICNKLPRWRKVIPTTEYRGKSHFLWEIYTEYRVR